MRMAHGVLTLALALAPAVAGACHLVPMGIAGSVGKLGDVSVAFGTADDAQHPTAWQGPLRITTGTAPACTVSDEVAVIEAPVLLGDGILYVPTYSGSNNRLYAVDARNCRVLWRSRTFNGPTRLGDGRLTIGGRPVPLDRLCRPTGMTKDGR
ncbi:PQQ-binding-like beta-propeller repeat protein [Rhodanobacter geophilus]|uniref:PQQ-binding-like beta-propeller repeat protein n=1 Tax=Rhodanobacter geophilus TaxID=3162488 RepID=A0ABV3QMZ2_9GAMM